MYFIEKVDVKGFWGGRNLILNFDRDINFIIGLNGSGKTTAVNIVVAALTADFAALDRLEFERIQIRLRSRKSRKRPTVTILKSRREGSPFPSIDYEIKLSTAEPAAKFSLEDYEEQIMLRGVPRHVMEREIYRRHGVSILAQLKDLVNVSWLSVNRISKWADGAGEDSRKFESTVDMKLQELSNRLVRYFSSLGKKGAQLLEQFQKNVFLSMLVHKSERGLFSGSTAIDVSSERDGLKEIFSQFGLDKEVYLTRLEKHFDNLEKARLKLNSREGLTNLDVAVLVGTERVDHIVDEWNKLVEQRKKILEPRENLLRIINGLMQRKKFYINDQNELQIETQSGKILPLTSLSSGEKQLLIG